MANIKDMLLDAGLKAYIVEIGAGCPIAQSIYEEPGASKVVYHSECPYGSAKDIYGDFIGEARMVSSQAVLRIAMAITDRADGKYNSVIVTSFQIRSGVEDTRIPHGWICLMIRSDDGAWRPTLVHLNLLSSRGRALDRSTSIDEILFEFKKILVDAMSFPMTTGGNYKFVDSYFSSVPNDVRVMKSNHPVFFKKVDGNYEQIRLEDYSRSASGITLYKGSFNPIHFGHAKIMELLKEEAPEALQILAISKNTFQKGIVDLNDMFERVKDICDMGYIAAVLPNGYFYNAYEYLRNRTNREIDLVMGVDTYNRVINCYETLDFSTSEMAEVNRVCELAHVGYNDKSAIMNAVFEFAHFKVFGRGEKLNDSFAPARLKYYEDFDCRVSSSEIRKLMEAGNPEAATKLKNGE